MAYYGTTGKYYSSGVKGTDKPVSMPIPKGKKISKGDTLDKEIKRLEVAAQTPTERKSRRTRRFHMLRTKPT
jgi:hypothetical protein